MPPADKLYSLAQPELLALLKKADELKRLIKAEPIRFYRPNPGGQYDFMTLNDPSVRVMLFIAGNKAGKTTGGAVMMAEFMCGTMLWGHDFRPPQQFRAPCYGVVFAEDYDSHKEVTLPAFLSWCPHKFIKDVRRNAAGHVVHIEFVNGNFLFFRTYEQGSEKAEGKDWDVAWCDEPPPRSIYTAVMRGMVTRNGLFYITATLLKETWLFDEAEDHSFIRSFGADIYSNDWLSDSARADFAASLTDDEREVRISGKPVSLVGVIYKEFRDAEPFVISDNIHFATDWPIIMMVDPHERKPLYIMWGCLRPDNSLVVFDWLCPKGDLAILQQEILAVESTHHMPSCLVVMDPNRGRAKQINDQSWEQVFGDWGYSVLLGQDDIKLGHTKVHTYLMAKSPSGAATPRIRFTERCRGKGGPVHSMLRYAWDDWAVGRIQKQQRDVKERPRDTYKDFPDLVRYVAMADLDFDTLKYGPKVLSTIDLSHQYRMGVRSF